MPQKEFLSAILKGEDSDLSQSLNEVKKAADNATDELSDLNDELQEFTSISTGAEQAADDTEDDINDLKNSSVKAANGVRKLSEKLRDSEDELITAGENSESLGDRLSEIFSKAKVGQEGIEEVRKEAKRIVSNFEGAEDKLQSFGRELGELSAEGEISESSLDELGEKAREILSDFEAAEEGADSFEDELREARSGSDSLAPSLQNLAQFIDQVGDESVEQVSQIRAIVDAIDRIEESAEDSDERLRLLKEAIENAGQESMQHIGSFESAGESVEGMADDATIAVTGMEGLQETLEKVADELETLVRLMKPVVGMLAELSKGARTAGSSMENLSDNTEEAADEMGPLMAGIFAASGAAEAGSQTMDRLADRLDDVEDEANEATAAMAGTASMSELLSLQSSALSINVGFFTVALRNLTTQVPLLVASLGTLITTLGGLAGAIGAAGVGGLGIALGGAAAEAERLAGPLEDTENAMEAFSAIAEELKDMFIEALQPLINADGAADAFISMMEGLATTVNAFSKSIARSFEEGALGQIFDVIGDAWMDSVADIATSIEALVEDVGLPIAENVIEPGIRAFSDFIDFINRTTQQMMGIFGVVSDSVGDFIRQLMQLGITVAAGLAPVLNSFFSTVSSVVDAFILTNREIQKFQDSAAGAGATVEEATEQLSGFRMETIATAVKTGVLLLALNRFAGILGSVIRPLTAIIGKLGLAAQSANTMGGAFLQTAGAITQGISEMSGGFGRLVGAFQMAIPAFASGDASLRSFGRTVDEAGGLLSYMAGRLSGARVESLRTNDAVDTLRAKFIKLGKARLTGLKESINGVTNALLTKLIPATMAAEETTQKISTIEGSGTISYRTTLTGVDALRERLSSLSTFVRNLPAKSFNAATDAIASGFYSASTAVGGTSESIKETGGVAQLVGSQIKGAFIGVVNALVSVAHAGALVKDELYNIGSAAVSGVSNIIKGGKEAYGTLKTIAAASRVSARRLLFYKQVTEGGLGEREFAKASSMAEALKDSLTNLAPGSLVTATQKMRRLGAASRVTASRLLLYKKISGSGLGGREFAKAQDPAEALADSVRNLLGGIKSIGGYINKGFDSALNSAVKSSIPYYVKLSNKLYDVRSAAMGAADSARFFGGAIRAMSTGGVSDNFLSGLRERFKTGMTPDGSLIHFGPETINTEALESGNTSGKIRSLFRQQYIDPITSSLVDAKDTITSSLVDTKDRAVSAVEDMLGGINTVLSGGLTTNLDGLSTKLRKTGEMFDEMSYSSARSRLTLENMSKAAVGTLSTVGLIGENSVASALGIEKLSGSTQEVTENLSEMDIAGRNVSDTIREAGNEFREFAGKEVAAVETTEDVKEEIMGVISATEVGEDNVNKLSRELSNLASQGKLAEKSQEDLKGTMNGLLTHAQVTDEQIEELAGKELYAAETTDEMKKELFGLAGAAELGEGHIDTLSNKMQKLAADGKLAEMSSEELTEELAQVGLASEFTDDQIEELGDEMTDASIRARLFAGASYGLSGALGVLSTVATAAAVSTGAILAAVAALVVIVGSAAAALMVLGDSGKSAEEIIADMQETLREVADTVMPLVVDSGNMMIDIFRSVKAVVGELIAGFKDIGVALGIIEEGAGDAASGMDMLAGAVETLRPIIQGIGDGFRLVFGNLATFIRDAFDEIAAFLEEYNAEEKVDTFVATVGRLYEELQKLKEPVKEFLAAAATVNVEVFKSLGKEIMEVADAMLGAVGLGEDIFGNIMSFIEGVGTYIYRLIPPILDLMMSLGDAIGGGLKALFGGLGAILKGIAGVIGFVVDGIMALLDGLTGDNAGGFLQGVVDAFQTIMELVGPAISLIADTVDVLATMGGVGAAFLGELWGLITDIGSFIGDVLLPLIEGIGAAFRYSFTVVKKIVTGTIDFIKRNFEFVVDFVTSLIEGDFAGAFNAIKTFIVDTFSGLVDFFAYVFGEAGRIAYEALAGIVETIVNGFLSIPDAITSAFDKIGDAIVNAIAGPWNDAIAGSYTIAKVPDWLPVPYSGASWDLTIDELGTAGGSGGGGGDSGGAVGSDAAGQLGRLAENVAEDTDEIPDVTISDATKDQEDLSGGGSTAGDFFNKVTDMVMPGGGPNNVTYNEGDTNNSFQQDISADPQDKAQISRIAKDAMEEANSFARRQQGGQ